ncbi:MAG TPA: hypothetical protein VF463_08210 [Sphingobium sp.]
MSRALNLTISEEEAVTKCSELGVEISVVEPLPEGGVHIVCRTLAGADLLRLKAKAKLIAGPVKRSAFYQARQW